MKNTFDLLMISILASLGFHCKSERGMDQGSADTEKMIRAVADGVLKDATFQFIDQKSGKRFASPKQAPLEAQLRPASAYTDWRY